MPYRQLADQRVIITGGSSGIGWHLAIKLAAAGCRVCVNARRIDRLAKLQSEIASHGGECLTVAGDISDPATRRDLLDVTQAELGGLDILINNAGIGAMGPFADASPERLRQLFEINFFAAVELTRQSLPLLQNGKQPLIVNMGSVLGHRAVPLKSEYCAAKFAMHGFSDSLRAELAGDGIDVLLVSPSTTDSEFFDRAIEDPTGRNWKSGGAMSPEVVADKTIRAMQRGRHEIILSLGGKSLVWLDRLMPWLADRLIARFGG